MGAGAVGCYYGAMLARAGHKVTLIGRPQHVQAVRRAGLRLQTNQSDEFIEVKASTEADGVRSAQLVLFSVKSTDTTPRSPSKTAKSTSACGRPRISANSAAIFSDQSSPGGRAAPKRSQAIPVRA